ncbi:hypothetical protein [Ralstonia phage RSK1]|uniref:Uncharacterized protein n=1 Tax=Ralstonia phage RSK1 TaxID=1417599 RepID=U6C6H9_9CAUD|nr:hypothetical protein X532_gp29 [Ralstonia phage RSK1]BAO04694.1 hypothetical protein [Ralstonia phage RSK1]
MTREEAVSIRFATFDAFAIWFRLWLGREPTAREVWRYLATRTSEAPAPTTQQQAEPSASAEIACSSCGLTMDDSKALAAMKQAGPGADETNPILLWAEIHRLRAEAQGPDGCVTWKDAAIAERKLRVAAQSGQRAGVAPEYVMVQRRMRPTRRPEGEGWTDWEECSEDIARDCERVPVFHGQQHEVRWLFAAQSGQRAGVAEGWQLVPKKPTEQMQIAGRYATHDNAWEQARAIWAAMLAAAPTK